MPRYFFDTRDGDRLERDDDGLDLESSEQARQEAERALADLARDVLPDGDMRELEIEVRDENDVIFVARMRIDAGTPRS